jgi:superfamily I DNA/RNA helicase
MRIFDDRITQYDSVAFRIKRLLNDGVMPSDLAVVARTNASLKTMGDVLNQYDVTYIRQMQSEESQRVKQVFRGFKSFLEVIVDGNENALEEFLLAYTTLESGIIKRLVDEQPRWLTADYEIPEKQKQRVKKCWRAIRKAMEIRNAETLMRMYQSTFGGDMNRYDPNGLFRYIKTLGIDLNGIECSELLDALEQQQSRTEQAQRGVELLTIHKAKGSGWKHVFVIDVYEGGMPHFNNIDDTEEIRIFFVAITRSSHQLYISGIRQEVRDAQVYGKRKGKGAYLKMYGKQVEHVSIDNSGNAVRRRSKRNHKPSGIMARKISRFLDVGEAIHEVADLRNVTHKEHQNKNTVTRKHVKRTYKRDIQKKCQFARMDV